MSKEKEVQEEVSISSKANALSRQTLGQKTALMNRVAEMLDKGELIKVQETAEFFDPIEGIEYHAIPEKMGIYIDEESKEVPSIYFSYREATSGGDMIRATTPTSMIVRVLGESVKNEEMAVYSIVFKGKIPTKDGKRTFNDFEIFRLVQA